MTPTEAAAYAQGVKDARKMALIAAVTIESRDDHREVRHQAAAEALHGFAEGLAYLIPQKTDPLQAVMAAIASDPATSGTVPCPHCRSPLHWRRDSTNGHLHMQCEAAGCLTVLQ